MNFDWEIKEHGQYEHGFVDVLKATIEGKKAVAIINYLPQFEDKDQKVLATILLETPKIFWTEGKVKSIIYDCEERLREVSYFKFRAFGTLDYMTIQTFFIKQLDDFELGTYGDFSFMTPIN